LDEQAEVIDPNVMALAVAAFELAQKEADSSVFDIKFTAPSGRATIKRQYAEIPVPRKSISTGLTRIIGPQSKGASFFRPRSTRKTLRGGR
jgi:hypothetical protein